MFGVTILGNNSAIPAFDRHPTSQLVSVNENFILIDCGEGTQMQLSKYKIKRSRINHILISHLHGDHYFGLIGLLTSFGLQSRTADLHLFGPPMLKDIIHIQLKAADTVLPYPLHFHDLVEEGQIIDTDKFSVSCFRVFHRIECWAFIVREKKKPRKLLKEKAFAHRIPHEYFDDLRDGKDYITADGSVVENSELTAPNTPAASYAFCADTLFNEQVARNVVGVKVIYHEATYLHADAAKAASRFHCTAVQAAQIAKKANAQKLLLGHFSSKYENLNAFLTEAREVFPASYLALEGQTFLI